MASVWAAGGGGCCEEGEALVSMSEPLSVLGESANVASFASVSWVGESFRAFSVGFAVLPSFALSPPRSATPSPASPALGS